MKGSKKEELKRLLKHRLECLERFNRWEAAHRERLSAAEAIRRIGDIYEMMPEEAKKKDLNAKIEGICKMHEAFAKLSKSKLFCLNRQRGQKPPD